MPPPVVLRATILPPSRIVIATTLGALVRTRTRPTPADSRSIRSPPTGRSAARNVPSMLTPVTNASPAGSSAIAMPSQRPGTSAGSLRRVAPFASTITVARQVPPAPRPCTTIASPIAVVEMASESFPADCVAGDTPASAQRSALPSLDATRTAERLGPTCSIAAITACPEGSIVRATEVRSGGETNPELDAGIHSAAEAVRSADRTEPSSIQAAVIVPAASAPTTGALT